MICKLYGIPNCNTVKNARDFLEKKKIAYDFSDFHQPAYPFISHEAALNSYGATHPGEDFAEAYKYYALTPSYFEELIQQAPERQQKYDFLKHYVFKGKEYW